MLSGTELKRAKRRVRARVLALRDAIDEGRRSDLGGRIVHGLLELPELAGTRSAMAFWSFGSEVPTTSLMEGLHARRVRLALPGIQGDEIVPLVYEPGDPTTPTSFGAREPRWGAGRVPPGSLDLVIVPGIAFDRTGRRIGYGGGFYDRFLGRSAPRALRISIAFDEQLLDEELPVGHADVPVHVIVTSSEIVRTPALSRDRLNQDSNPRYNVGSAGHPTGGPRGAT